MANGTKKNDAFFPPELDSQYKEQEYRLQLILTGENVDQ